VKKKKTCQCRSCSVVHEKLLAVSYDGRIERWPHTQALASELELQYDKAKREGIERWPHTQALASGGGGCHALGESGLAHRRAALTHVSAGGTTLEEEGAVTLWGEEGGGA
jgi:hypothetical protein